MNQVSYAQRIDNRIELIRNPTCQKVCRAFYWMTSCFFHILFSASRLATSNISLLFRCSKRLGTIPGFVKNILFSSINPSQKPSAVYEKDLNKWLDRILITPLSDTEREKIHQAVKGELSHQQEIELLDILSKQPKQPGVEVGSTKELLTKLLSLAKEALNKEKAEPLTPLEKIKSRESSEIAVITRLADKIQLIDAEAVKKCVHNPDEALYLDSRAEFIRTQLPQLDQAKLWDACSNPAGISVQDAEGVHKQIDALQEQIEEEIEKNTSRSQSLLPIEYCLLLRQRLSLNSDVSKWDRGNPLIDEFNKTSRQALIEFHKTFVERWNKTESFIKAHSRYAPPSKSLENLNPEGEIALYFQQAHTLLKELHEKELQFLAKNPNYLESFLEETGHFSLKEVENHIMKVIDIPARQEFLSIRDDQARKEDRHVSLAKQLLYACIEKSPDGQQIFRLLRLKNPSKEDRALISASKETIEALYEKNSRALLNEVRSTPEFIAEIGASQFASLSDLTKGHSLERNLSSLEQKLNLGMQQWYKSLQEIWITHLSIEQELRILSPTGEKRTQKMAREFSLWMLRKTLLPFNRALSFDSIKLPSEKEKSIHATQTLLTALSKRPPKASKAPLPTESPKEFSGVLPTSISLEPPAKNTTEIVFESPDFDVKGANLLGQQKDSITLLKESNPYNPSQSLDVRIQWILDAYKNPLYQEGLHTGLFSLYAAFQDIAISLQTPASNELLNAFLNVILHGNQGAFHRDNLWRKEALRCYLQMITIGKQAPLDVSDEQRNYLIQFSTLAEYPLPQIDVVDDEDSDFNDLGIERVGKVLQTSEIGLEGLEESAIQLSFQNSTLATTPQIRTFIDALRARQGNHLSLDLLDSVLNAYPLDHDQGQQAIERALSYALQNLPKQEILTYFQNKLNLYDPAEIDPATLALPPRIFFCDCLLRLIPDHVNALKETELFNKKLINSSSAPQMFVGFAREIERLSSIFAQDPSAKNFAALLKTKIAFQALKITYFDGKIEIEGFLKVALDKAEFAIAYSTERLKAEIALLDVEEVIDLVHETENPDPSQRTFAEKAVEKVFKNQKEQGLKGHFEPPFFLSFGKTDIDLLSGIVYFDGQQRLELPLKLQNHPYIRSLQLQDLPFSSNPDGSFSHYTTEANLRVPQVRLAFIWSQKEDDEMQEELIIQKRLPTSFTASKNIQPLQYIPLEKITEIPAALSQRLGVKDFWMGPDETLYGHSKNGVLLFSLSKDGKVTTPLGSFKFPIGGNFENTPPVLKTLLKALPADEILIKEDLSAIYIPALNLTLSEGLDNAWHCTSPSISGMVLDVSDSHPDSILVLKKEGAQKASKELEDEMILSRKRLREIETEDRPSLFVKAEIKELKKKIAEIECRLAQMNPHLYIAMIPETRNAADLRENLLEKSESLIELSEKIAGEKDSLQSQHLQKTYLFQEEEYHRLQKEYQTYCVTDKATVALRTFDQTHITATDLPGLLFLLGTFINTPSPSWIQELAKHPFNQPLTETTLNLLKTAIERFSNNSDGLSLYLHLILCHHTFLLLQQTAAIPTPKQGEKLFEAHKEYVRLKGACEYAALPFIQTNKELPSEIQSLLHTHCPHTLIAAMPAHQYIPPLAPFAAKELLALSSQSLLERLRLQEEIVALAKNPVVEIPEAQKKLVKDFKSHSFNQAEGFYFEEFGLFSIHALYREFSLKGTEALFGLSKDHLDAIFASLVKMGWIKQSISLEERLATSFYYSVSAERSNPLTRIQKEDLLAMITHLPLPPLNHNQIADRLRTFLLQATQAHFAFSWKSEKAAFAALNTSLEEERQSHHAKMLDAEFFLNERLKEAGISLTEFKRRVLLKNHQGVDNFAACRNALLRYLFHKTELQHITNTLKAPVKGERNQIELLSTARQYPVELLFREAVDPKEKDDQIMQLAFLLFEEDYGARCNAMQIQLFRSMMLSPNHREAVDAMQARMGFGKTALLPLMALVEIAKQAHLQKDKKSLIRYVVPKAVLQDNAAAFHERLSHILGSNVLKDREFSRYQINPADKATSFNWILQDLQYRLDFYEHARNEGLVLIQWPEIRQSMEAQELAFGFLLISNTLSSEEAKLCLKCKQMLGRVRAIQTYTIFDELDATQDFKACEVNFTEGAKLPIDKGAIWPLEKLIHCIAQHHAKNKEDLALEMLKSVQLEAQSQLLTPYITDRAVSIGDINGLRDFLDHLQQSNPEGYAAIFLIRAILLDHNIFAFAYNRQPNTHFGVRFIEQDGKRVYSEDPESGSPLLIAVPYEGTNTPKGLSTFDNTEVAAITTLRYYLSKETLLERDLHVDFLITQTKKQALPLFLAEIVKNIRNSKQESFTERLSHIAGLLDSAEIEQAKQKFYEDFFLNPPAAVRSYLGMAVVATQVRSDEARANSNRYELGSPLDRIKGCSGTVSSTSSYFEKPDEDPAADGKLSLEIMGRENNAPIALLAPIGEENSDYLGHILDSLLEHAKPQTRAIIDAAGICKSRDGTPETIVRELWVRLQRHRKVTGIEGIVYYGKDNIKRVYRGPQEPPIPCTTSMELAALPGKKYFSFYGQKNTRGSDIKQADKAHALISLDDNVPNNDAKQAVLRFRSLVQRSSGQTFTFVLTRPFAEILRAKKQVLLQKQIDRLESSARKTPEILSQIKSLQAQLNEHLDAKDVVKELRKTELLQQQHDALLLFTKELHAHVKQAAAHIEHQIFSTLAMEDAGIRTAYQTFLKERDAIVPLVERALSELEDKYGGSLKSMARDLFIQQQILLAQQKLQALQDLANTTCQKLNQVQADLGLVFFQNRIERSCELFKSRYPQETPVEISAVDSGAQAVAMAMAQAQAQAQAEALAQRINENVVHSLNRLPDLRIEMTDEPCYEINKNWVKKPQGTPISNFINLDYLIHPGLRGSIQLSPHLSEQRIVSHFALIPTSQNRDQATHIFISQEEAEQWKTLPLQQRPLYQLIDLRHSHATNHPCVLNMQGAVLHYAPSTPTLAHTSHLRNLKLPNVDAKELLPKLSIKGAVKAELEKWIDLSTFGVWKDGALSLTLDRQQNDTLLVCMGKAQIAIPMKNEWLLPIFIKVYNNDQPKKIRQVQAELYLASQAFRAQLAELQRQQAELAKMKSNLNALVQDASQFNINHALQKGLLERDAENRTVYPKVQKCGQLFLNKIQEIKAAQAVLKQDPSEKNLKQLYTLFEEFASPKIFQFQGDLANVPIFDQNEWSVLCNRNDNLYAFDLVYGRLIYGGFHNGPSDASVCYKEDCKQIFNVMIPALKATLEKISSAIAKLPQIQQEIDIIEASIKELEAKKKSLDEADQCIQDLTQNPLSNAWTDQGILFVEPGNDPALFWDRFHFETLDDPSIWAVRKIDTKLKGALPLYCKTAPRQMQEYAFRIHALNQRELQNKALYEQTLIQPALKLAQTVEPRKEELLFI